VTLLVNPLRNPLAAHLFSIKYYKKHLCPGSRSQVELLDFCWGRILPMR
jgi:hypothetical protein